MHSLLHHNAQTAAATLDFLEENHVQLVIHPLVFLDLAPCNFFLFSKMKQQFKGKQFQGIENVCAFFKGMISDKSLSIWFGTMITWFKKMSKCMHGWGVGVGT